MLGPHAGHLGMIWGSCGSFPGTLRSHLGVSRELSRASSELSWNRLGVLWELPGRQSVTVRRGRPNRQGKRGRSGRPVKTGRPGKLGKPGKPGKSGNPGKAIQAGRAGKLPGWLGFPVCLPPTLPTAKSSTTTSQCQPSPKLSMLRSTTTRRQPLHGGRRQEAEGP